MKNYLLLLHISFFTCPCGMAQQLNHPKLTLPNGHTAWVKSAEFSPDGKSILTASWDNTAKIWDATSGKLLHSLEGQTITSGNVSAKFSSDGKSIVTASGGKTAKIWDAATGKLFHSLEHQYDDNVHSVQFSPDGKRIVTGSYDNAKIWDASSGKLLHSLEGLTSGPVSAEFSPDGKSIVTASRDNTAKIWDAASGKLLHSLEGHTLYVHSAKFSPDGKSILSYGRDNTAKIWDAASGKLMHSLEGHTEMVILAEFSPDGKSVVTGSWDSTARIWIVKIWDAVLGKKLHVLEGRFGQIFSAEFSPDGKNFVTCSSAETAKIWETATGKLLHSLEGHTEVVLSAKFTPDGKSIVTASHDNTAIIWDAASGKLLQSLEGHADYSLFYVRSAIFSPDGKNIVTDSPDGTAKIWDAASGKLLNTLNGHSSEVRSAIFSPDGKSILTTSVDNTMKIWDVQTGKVIFTRLELRNNDWLVYDEHYRYDGTEAARAYLYFVCGSEIIDLAQMKDALYVPGLVEKIMSGQEINDPRLSELDICDALPLVEEEKTAETPYSYKITQRRLAIKHVELYINDKKIYTIPIDQLTKAGDAYFLKFKTEEITRHFVKGAENKVNVIAIVYAANGSELKSRGAVVVSAKEERKPASPPKLFAVMVGVNKYKDQNLNLNYPVKDALDLGKALSASAAKLLGKENVIMYTINSDVKAGVGYSTPEKSSIKKAFEDIGKRAKPEDVVLVFFAGHGVMQGAEEKRFTFLTAEASGLNPAGINTKEIQDWLSYEGPHKMLANKTILIFDACNSGQATQELIALARNDDDTRRIRQVEDLKDKSGMFILAASAPNQAAYELPQYEQGLLTYSLLSVLKSNPDILDDGQYLNVQKWFLESEKFLKQLVESHGYKQDAQPFGSANIRIGLVDEDVTKSIVLAKEKPVMVCANVLNSETFNDDLKLKDLVNEELSEISERGAAGEVIFVRQETPDANKINIIYQIAGENIVCQIRLQKDREQLHQSTIHGTKNDMDGLAKKIIEEVILYAR
jgi:WD40 repeat protein